MIASLSRRTLLALFVSSTALTLWAAAARAALIEFDLSPFTGDPAAATVTIDDNSANVFRINVQVVPAVPSGNIGDITGVFFDLSPLVAQDNITIVTGGPIIGFANNTQDLGDGVNLTGGGPANPGLFDVGLRFDGFSVDDVQEIEFLIDRADADLAGLTLNDFDKVGLRLQTVGPIDGGRGGSSKLWSVAPAMTPEPATLITLLLGGVGLLRLKRSATSLSMSRKTR